MKKRKRSAAHVLLPVVALLVVLLVAVALLYLRSVSRPLPSPEEGAAPPAETVVSAPRSVSPSPVPSLQPLALRLDVDDTAEGLDVVVCDSDGLAVPGFAFPLEIRREDGSSYTVKSDVNGHYHAEYLPGGSYAVSLLPMEGFSSSGSASCTVTQKGGNGSAANIGRFAEEDEESELPGGEPRRAEGAAAASEIEGLAEALPPEDDGEYRYRCAVGENGFLLLADGTESDVLPVEERGSLVYGVRRVSVYRLLDGTRVQPEALPEGAVLWTDYYIDEQSVAVRLILGGGRTDERYAITAEKIGADMKRTGWVEENGRLYYYAADGRPLSGLQDVDGKLYFFDGSGAKASSLGIDVSYHNSMIDWNAVKDAGIDFAIIRAGYRTWEKGILNEDEDSYRQGKNGGFYLQGAKAAGLKVGVYVYSTAVSTAEAVEEAELALDVVRKSGVELDLPIFFDTEYSGANPRGRADRLNVAQRAEIAKAFCETVEKAGYRAGVYSYEYFFNRALRLEDVADYAIWYASYTTGYALPGYRGFDIWQFSESVRVNGMPDQTDINVIF